MELLSTVLEAFRYDSQEGALYWSFERPIHHFKTTGAHRTYLGRFSGKRAGCVVKIGNVEYNQIRLQGKLYLEHHLIWLLEHGELPMMLDHEDGNGLNNQIVNLRLADKTLNGQNCRMKCNNTSGVTGVYFHNQNKNWVAEGHWTEGGVPRKRSLGSYATIEEAAKAREAWTDSRVSFTERHGK